MIVYDYRLFCQTEDDYVNVLSTDNQNPPTKCPNNSAHILSGIPVIVNQMNNALQTDDLGAAYSIPKMCEIGMHFQLKGFTITSGVYNSLIERDWKNHPCSDTVVNFYDASGIQLNATSQDNIANATQTQLTWTPNYNYYLMGGMVKVAAQPTSDAFLSVVVAPQIPSSYGGQIPLISNLNLLFFGNNDLISAASPSTKLLTYQQNGMPGTNSLQWNIYHGVGVQVKMEFLVQHYH